MNLGAFWREVKETVQRQSPLLAAALEHAGLGACSDAHITALLPDKFQCDQLERHRAKVELVMQEIAGFPVRLEVKQGGERAAVLPSTIQAEASALDVDRRRREDEARKHPMIQKAQDVFGAKVTGIKT